MLTRLPEETTFNDIRARVTQAEVAFTRSEAFQDSEQRLAGAKLYLTTLREAVREIGQWEEGVNDKFGYIQIGVPDPDCPYRRLYKKTLSFIVRLRKTRDDKEKELHGASR
jgi:hypothetical protein